VADQPMIKVENLSIDYPVGRGGWFRSARKVVRAVNNVSFHIGHGETLGLVGESGSGKTTTGRAAIRRLPIAEGTVQFDGKDITNTSGEQLRQLRRNMQMIFQDPYGSLNPRKTILDTIAEPLIVHGIAKNTTKALPRVRELLSLTGMPPDAINRFPHAFSGGQRQRIGIARALAAEPDFLVVDEPVAALDTSIQAQVVNLLQDLQQRMNLTYLFIAHDLSVVRHISDRVAIMYAGELVELADRDEVYDSAIHPYTQSLLSAVPIPEPEVQRNRQRIVIPGEVPDPSSPPPGCRFHTRCPFKQDERCDTELVVLRELKPGHMVACHYAEEIASGKIVMNPAVA
jgi:oligopeptide/dipeptide ABC transporter ATP-binding protein